MRDCPSASCDSAIERLLGIGDVDPQMRRCRRPPWLRVEQHDHSVPELDLNVADAAIGAQHPRARCLLGVEGGLKERNLGLGVRADYPRVYARVARRNRHCVMSTGHKVRLAWPSDSSRPSALHRSGCVQTWERPTSVGSRGIISDEPALADRDRRQCRITSMTVPGNPYRHHTHRLDLEDPLIREWAATVLLADADQGIVLDRSAFYPGGGGQPPDHGVLLWGNVRTRIVGTRKGDDLYLLPAEGDPLPPAGTSVHGGLDDERRTSLMRTHSGLHVLSAIVLRDFGAPVTGGNMEPLIARMDFDLSDVPADFKQRVEDACNEAVRLNRQIDVRVLPREQALAIPNIIRTASDLLPPDIEMVRIVDINGIDIQADGGTHVASTAMIGRIAVTKMESKGRGFRRLRIRIEDAE